MYFYYDTQENNAIEREAIARLPERENKENVFQKFVEQVWETEGVRKSKKKRKKVSENEKVLNYN